MLTFREARNILAKYAGRAGLVPNDERVPDFVVKVLQYLMFQFANGTLRKFTFIAENGVFTIPPELEAIEKIKIDDRIATSWNKWYEFHSTTRLGECLPANAAFEEPNSVPMAFALPSGGVKIGIQGRSDEAPDSSIIIHGVDVTGRPIDIPHEGVSVGGEFLQIQKGVINATSATFASVTGITKTPTFGYATLYWLNPATGQKGFLSDYGPLEQNPAYRQYRIDASHCRHARMKVEVLGRIRLREAYTDNDLIPFENIAALTVAGQALQEHENRNLSAAAAGDQLLGGLIERENEYKTPNNGQPIEFFRPLSGGSIKNINGGRRY